MNNFMIIGHVGQAPKTIEFESGKKLVKFSVAEKEYSNGKEEEPQTTWFDVQAWNGLGDIVATHVTKGREIVVQGRLAIEEYENREGIMVKKPVITMTGFHLCGKKPVSNTADESQIGSEEGVKKSKKALVKAL